MSFLNPVPLASSSNDLELDLAEVPFVHHCAASVSELSSVTRVPLFLVWTMVMKASAEVPEEHAVEKEDDQVEGEEAIFDMLPKY